MNGTLSRSYAYIDFGEGYGGVTPVSSVELSLDETRAPYAVAEIEMPSSLAPDWLDPRYPTYLTLHLQQDFGDLVEISELTDAFGGSVTAVTAAFTPVVIRSITAEFSRPWNIFETGLPISTITASFGGDVSTLTAAGFGDVASASEFLHTAGTWTPKDSNKIHCLLMLRTVTRDYLTGMTSLTLSSLDANLVDSIGYPTDIAFGFNTAREAINFILSDVADAQLVAGAADHTFSEPYTILFKPDLNGWELIKSIADQSSLVVYCDEAGAWRLEPLGSTAGTLVLDDETNILQFTKTIDRNSSLFFDHATLQYKVDSLPVYDSYATWGWKPWKSAFFDRSNETYIGSGAALNMVGRAFTRAQTYDIGAVADLSARPRQSISIDYAAEPVVTGTVQSVSWRLPECTMDITLRNVSEE